LAGGEEPRACAARELEEECGLLALEWSDWGSFYTSPGFCSEEIHLFFAKKLVAVRARPDEDEILQPGMFPLSEALKMVTDGTIKDAKTIIAVYKMVLHRDCPVPRADRPGSSSS